MNKRLWLFWLGVTGLTVLLYYRTFNYYFFQDDFYLFNMSRASNLKEVWGVFRLIPGVTFYRPVSMLVFYNLMSKIVGYSSVGYHLLGLGLHLINAMLIYVLVNKLAKNKPLSLLVSFFYAVSANHYITLAWVAAFHYLLGLFWGLIAWLSFIKGIENKKLGWFLGSIGFYILAILSEQIMVSLPLLIIAGVMIMAPKAKQLFYKFWWYFISLILINGLYLALRFLLIKVPINETYQVAVDLRVLKNIFWQGLWSLNVPEDIKYQMVSFFRINPKFVTDFPVANKLVWLFFAGNLTLGWLIPGVIILTKKLRELVSDKWLIKQILFGIAWFILALLPGIWFPDHQYPYFATLAGIGLLIVLLSPVSWLMSVNSNGGNKRRWVGYSLLLALTWYGASLINFEFTQKIHWIKDRQEVSRTYLQLIKNQFPEPESGTTIVLPGAKKIIKHALMNDEAAFFLYGDKQVHLDYADFEPPEECGLIREERLKKIKLLYPMEETDALYRLYQDCLERNKIFFLEKSEKTESTLFHIN